MPTQRKKRVNIVLNYASRVFIRLTVFTVFILILLGVILYARGYRPDFRTRSLTPTGILAFSSSPKAAKVYVNGVLKGATDLNLTLPPGQYFIEIKKEGYTDWNKNILLKGEVVLSLDGVLFPKNPSLSPLTSLGIAKVIPVDQTNRLILVSNNNDSEKDGLYIFDASKKPLSLLPPLKILLLKKYLLSDIQIESVEVTFSPDYRQGIFEFMTDQNRTMSYLLSLDEENAQVFDITASKETLLSAWKQEKNKVISRILETFPKEMIKIASDSFKIVSFSPDENKILYQVAKTTLLPPMITPPLIGTNQMKETRNLEPSRLYVYDRKEDKNFEIQKVNPGTIPTPTAYVYPSPSVIIPDLYRGDLFNLILWYPDSRHLIIKDKKQIVIVDYDNSNRRTMYSGPFEEDFFTVTDTGKLIILTNFNPQNNTSSDLYEVGIK